MSAATLAAAGILGGSLGACEDSPTDTGSRGSLSISSVRPEADAGGVEVGAPVTVTFSQGVAPSTVNAETLRLSRFGVQLPSTVRYDPETRTATLVGPTLPGSTYEVSVGTGVATLEGDTLNPPEPWSFTTRSWNSIPIGTGGTLGSLAVGSDERRHLAYRNGRDLMYATCAMDCAAQSSWHAVTLVPGEGRFGFSPIAVEPESDRLHLSYGWNYATCALDCTMPDRWSIGTVYMDVGGPSHSIAVGDDGRIHAAYRDGRRGSLVYQECSRECTGSSSWQKVIVDDSGRVGVPTSLALGADGRVHVTYFDQIHLDLEYGTCGSDCGEVENWHLATLAEPGAVGYESSLAVDSDGRLHLTYYEESLQRLVYATCSQQCQDPASWRRSGADHHVGVGRHSSLGVDDYGRLHVAYHDAEHGSLRYGTCTFDCTAGPGHWMAKTVATEGDLASHPWIALYANGRVGVVYDADTLPSGRRDDGQSELRYLE